jgi:hypothetical protein
MFLCGMGCWLLPFVQHPCELQACDNFVLVASSIVSCEVVSMALIVAVSCSSN